MVDRDWRALSDMHTLKEAEEIKGDRGRMRAAQSAAKQEAKLLSRVGGAAPAKPRANREHKLFRKPI